MCEGRREEKERKAKVISPEKAGVDLSRPRPPLETMTMKGFLPFQSLYTYSIIEERSAFRAGGSTVEQFG